MQMDTTSIVAVSRLGIICAEELTAAVEQQLKRLELMEATAVMSESSFVECVHIVSLRRTFVNGSNTTSYTAVFTIFCAEHTTLSAAVQNRLALRQNLGEYRDTGTGTIAAVFYNHHECQGVGFIGNKTGKHGI